MITDEALDQFLDWPEVPQKKVLSVYLDLESTGEAALRRRFEFTFKSLAQGLKKQTPADELEALEQDIESVRKFIADYEPNGRGLVIFSSRADGFIWAKELQVHVKDHICRLDKPYVLPLLEAFDEHERCGVALIGREKARIFTCSLGQIEEETGAIAWNDVSRYRTTGKDNLKSAFKLQRTTELHELWHLKHAVKLLEEMLRRHPFQRLIVGGPRESADEFVKLLTPELSRKLAGRIAAGVSAPEKELLEALNAAVFESERREEAAVVAKLLREDAALHQGLLGLDAALLSLDRGNVHRLVYSENFRPEGSRCPECGYLFANGRQMCGRCSRAVAPVPDLLEEMARTTLLCGGTIEEVRGEAAGELDRAGGVGVILKKREKR